MLGNRLRKWAGAFAAALFMAGVSVGCGRDAGIGTKVVLTTGFGKDEVFRIETSVCTLPEIMVYLTNIQNRYESVYGPEIWNTNVDGVTLEQNVKDIALAQIHHRQRLYLLVACCKKNAYLRHIWLLSPLCLPSIGRGISPAFFLSFIISDNAHTEKIQNMNYF